MTRLTYKTTLPNASLPDHALDGDVGIDITAVCVHKVLSTHTVMYDTGICIQPEDGYYVEIVPRSSIVKTGYILSNSIAIIDQKYRGSLKIVLTRVDPTVPALQLPFTLCQLILRKAETIEPVLVDELDDTVRGNGGFGSTNK